ncbi:MAG TPA: hypothetical protein VJN96_09165 [Vicinamibacterales bacterium]|nr:hypothetical protein [Vicinamibacterales bacterium]
MDPGPLAPIGDELAPLVIPAGFVDLTNGHIADTYPHHDALDRAQQTIAAASDSSAFDRDAGGAVDQADAAHQAHAGAFDNADPSDVVASTDAHSSTIDGHRGDYDETAPPPASVPDPGTPPEGDGGGTPPPEI